jgi:hypothetical protein
MTVYGFESGEIIGIRIVCMVILSGFLFTVNPAADDFDRVMNLPGVSSKQGSLPVSSPERKCMVLSPRTGGWVLGFMARSENRDTTGSMAVHFSEQERTEGLAGHGPGFPGKGVCNGKGCKKDRSLPGLEVHSGKKGSTIPLVLDFATKHGSRQETGRNRFRVHPVITPELREKLKADGEKKRSYYIGPG